MPGARGRLIPNDTIGQARGAESERSAKGARSNAPRGESDRAQSLEGAGAWRATQAASAAPQPADIDRLERAVRALVDKSHRLELECGELRSQIEDRDQRLRDLDEKLLTANQLRQDAVKRLDDLIAQVDQLGAHLAPPSDERST